MSNVIHMSFGHPKINHVYNIFDGSILYPIEIKDNVVKCRLVFGFDYPSFGKAPSEYDVSCFTDDTYICSLDEFMS